LKRSKSELKLKLKLKQQKTKLNPVIKQLIKLIIAITIIVTAAIFFSKPCNKNRYRYKKTKEPRTKQTIVLPANRQLNFLRAKP
jgi:hypothetical protein